MNLCKRKRPEPSIDGLREAALNHSKAWYREFCAMLRIEGISFEEIVIRRAEFDLTEAEERLFLTMRSLLRKEAIASTRHDKNWRTSE